MVIILHIARAKNIFAGCFDVLSVDLEFLINNCHRCREKCPIVDMRGKSQSFSLDVHPLVQKKS